MPRLVRLYISQVLIGFLAAGVFVALLMWLNVGNLWHLVTHSPGGVVAVIMLVIFNGIVFAGVQFAWSIMRLARDENGPGGGHRRPEPVAEPRLVPVRAIAGQRRR